MTSSRLRATALVVLSVLTAAGLYSQTPLTRVDRSDARVRNLLRLPLAFESRVQTKAIGLSRAARVT